MIEKLTDIQKQFWTLNSLGKIDTAYNMVLAVKINGQLDTEKLNSSWIKLWSVLSEKWQDFIKENVCPWEFIVLTRDEAEKFLRRKMNICFNLEHETPVRVSLIQTADNEFIFSIIVHHILIDLRVKELFSGFLSDFYNNEASEIELTDYRFDIPADQKEKQMRFWKEYLRESPEPLLLPPGKEYREAFSGTGKTVFRDLSSELSAEIKALDGKGEYQQFIVFLTCYSVLLKKISGQDDFFIGIPFPNRRHESSENMCGPRVNILPLRVKITFDTSFSSLYHYIRKQMLLLHRNQEFPFVELVKQYDGERKKEIPHFLQAGFTREEPFNLNLSGLECAPVELRPDGSQMDLFFTYWNTERSIKYRWEYNNSAFTEKQIFSFLESYESLVEKFIKNPEWPVSDICILNNRDKQKFDDYYSELRRDYHIDIPLRKLLLKSYKENAEKNAVRDNRRSYSYMEFESLVFKYSGYLTENVGSSHRVAVAMDSSIERIALIHAIIISGNSYIPVDPRWPEDRVHYILNNAEATACIVDDNYIYGLDFDPRSAAFSQFSGFSGVFDEKTVTADDIFAVLYTSGSTGEPKGVQISEKGIINRLYWMQETFPLDPDSRLIHKVPYTFDVSIWEIFWPFLFGASLYIPDQGVHLDNNHLADILRKERITYIHFVPSLLRNFLRDLENTKFPDLKGVICSGEALDVQLVSNFHLKLPHIGVHNLYGPTEASIDVTALRDVDENIFSFQVPIGYPIANTRIYIIDNDRNICPPFVRGEIAIAGISLARGYINNAEQTEKVFIEGDWGWGNETIYLTGDIGYYHESCLVYY